MLDRDVQTHILHSTTELRFEPPTTGVPSIQTVKGGQKDVLNFVALKLKPRLFELFFLKPDPNFLQLSYFFCRNGQIKPLKLESTKTYTYFKQFLLLISPCVGSKCSVHLKPIQTAAQQKATCQKNNNTLCDMVKNKAKPNFKLQQR